jgi:hypothetical protein
MWKQRCSGQIRGGLAWIGVVILASLVVAQSGAARSSRSSQSPVASSVSCAEAGTGDVTYNADELLGPRTFTITFGGPVTGCRSSDPSITSGTEIGGVGTGTLDCLAGARATDSGSYTIRWSNGRTSDIAYSEHSRFAIGHTDGTVIRGEFKGLTVHDDDVEGGDPRLCLTPQGNVAGFYLGRFVIG